MSRIPKYRAWHKTEKKMYGPFTLGDLYGYEGEVNAVTLSHPYSSEGQSLVLCQHRGGSPFYPQLEAGSGINPDIELLEFTGLVDKHGVEVYIGDIVKGVTSDYQDKRKQYTRIKQVAYDENMCLQPFHDIWDYDEHLWMHCLVDGFEVIGDIYRTPHLLREGEQ